MKTEENDFSRTHRSHKTKGLGFGLFLMILGAVLLGFNSGLIPDSFRQIVLSWPMFLIVIGIGQLLKRNHEVSGIILLLVGCFFITPRITSIYPSIFPWLNTDFTHLFWPLLLIACGALLIVKRTLKPSNSCHNWDNRTTEYKARNNNTGGRGFSKNSIFGSGEHIVLDPEFEGGEINAVFGGVTLDLRRTNLAEGETYLEINAVFGGVTILVPSTWHVEPHIDTVFGGFQDNRMLSDNIDKTRKLIISGSCVFGGGELK